MPSSEELADADELSAQLVRLVRLLDRAHAHYQAEHPDAVERATYHLLVHLVRDGPRRAGALAEAVHSDPSTISRQVAHLVRLGLVLRTADPEDGRATLLVATDEGKRVFEENRRMRNERIATMTSGWDPADRRSLSRLLARFVTDFECYKAGVGVAWSPRPPEPESPRPPDTERSSDVRTDSTDAGGVDALRVDAR